MSAINLLTAFALVYRLAYDAYLPLWARVAFAFILFFNGVAVGAVMTNRFHNRHRWEDQ